MEHYRRIICLLLCFLLLNNLGMTALAEEFFEEIPEEFQAEASEEIWEETWEDPDFTEELIPEEEFWEEVVPEEILSEDEISDTGVPLYLQTDYPDIYYGEGTIATSGCSITSLAMVAGSQDT